MFSVKADQQIFDQIDMSNMIKRQHKNAKYGKPHEQPRAAIQRMRLVVGTYLYMRETEVNKIFVDQVNRIGNQLENLENALARNPKTVTRKGSTPNAQGVIEDRVVVFKNWPILQLKEKWFKYMNQVYTNANNKGKEFMKENLKQLKAEYNDAKLIKQEDVDKQGDHKKQEEMKLEKQLREDMKKYIAKLEAEWNKANHWSQPGWNL